MIHTTVGVYSNDTFKINGVDSDNLENHIEYNLKMRPGRAFFVDGKCLNQGYLNETQIKDWTKKVQKMKKNSDTAPYL